MERNPIVIGQLVRNKRLEKKIGVREFSRVIGVSPGYVSQLEKGTYKNPSDEVLINIFNVLGFEEKYRTIFGLSEMTEQELDAQIKNKELKKILLQNLMSQFENLELDQIELYIEFMLEYRDIAVKIVEIEKKAEDKAKLIHSIREYVDFIHNKHVVNRVKNLFE